MQKAVVAGVGMTPFRRSPGTGNRALAVAAAVEALADAGITADAVEKIFFGNAAGPTVTEQTMILGQVAFRRSDLAGLPVVNVENACASGSSAFHLAVEAVTSGQAEVVLVVGSEQLTHRDKTRSFKALRGSTDINEIGEASPEEDWTNSILMEFYAQEATSFLQKYDATLEDMALVAVKNRYHASMNPLAQYRDEQTVDQVLRSRVIVDPLTLAMCSPLTDGAAAVVLTSEDYARRNTSTPTIRVLASELRGGQTDPPVVEATRAAYDTAGLGVTDMHLIELHDAAAPAELIQYAEIGLCEEGEGTHLIRSGETRLGGRIPVNTSGGLMSRGHPLGATGVAQIVEITTQLRQRAEERQVSEARLGMAVNSGGWLSGLYAVAVATILQAVH